LERISLSAKSFEASVGVSTSLADVESGLSLGLRDPKDTGVGAKDRNFFKDPPPDSGDEGAIDSDGSSVTATASDFLVTSVSVLDSVLGFDVAVGGTLGAETSAAILLSTDVAFDKTRKQTSQENEKVPSYGNSGGR
jgi:hypothetical protein